MANPLDSFKQLPAWGKAAVAAGGAGAVYLVWRARKNAAAAPATSPDSLTTPDQATGAGTGDGLPVAGPGTGGVPVTVGTTSGYGTNAAWSQAAQAGLAEVGFDSVSVATALGAYLAGQTLTADQAAIVFAATSEFGAPPVSPPPVTLSSSTGPAVTGNGTGDTGGTGGTTAGGSTAPKSQTSTVSAGRIVSANNNDVVVAWNHAGPATSWRVTLHFPGSENGRSNTVGSPQAHYSGLPAGHSGYVEVQPLPSGQPGRIDIHTTKGK
jgi:hypothetical protein